jgi:hypothetical protein
VRIALCVYVAAGLVFAAAAAAVAQTFVVALAIIPLVAAGTLGIWLCYRMVIWMFEREARQSVDISDGGVREIHSGREYAFIPWEGIKEIEINGTLFAGTGLRIRGNFSEITISNADLTIEPSMGIGEMHRAFAQTGTVLGLLHQMKDRAPAADVKMNRLARRRLERRQAAAAAEPLSEKDSTPGS